VLHSIVNSLRSFSSNGIVVAVVGLHDAAVCVLLVVEVQRCTGSYYLLLVVCVPQVLQFINCQLFNQLLLRPECCSASNARYVLRGLKQLDGWLLAEHGSTAGYAANTAATAAAAAAGAAADGEGASSGDVGAGNTAADDKLQDEQQQQQQQQQSSGLTSPPPAAAAAASGEEGDAGWEQIPADTGEIDSWQPAKQQQQQQPGRVRLWQWQMQAQEQQQQQGPLTQHDIGPEAWHALSHIRQVSDVLV
jgi:hypothetical protein